VNRFHPLWHPLRRRLWTAVVVLPLILWGIFPPPLFGEEPEEPPPFQAGFRAVSATDPATGDAIPIAIWYPTGAEESEHQFDPYALSVASGGAPAAGPFPLILASHGHAGSAMGHHEMGTHLARRGMIVAAPTHPGDNWEDISGAFTERQLAGRSRHLRATLNRVLADPELGPAADADRIGAVGFSMGGYGVLTLAGAVPQTALIHEYCAEEADDPLFCSPERLSRLGSIEGEVRPVHDGRVRAAVLLAPAFGMLFDAEALEGVAVPVRIYRGVADRVLRHPHHAARIARLLPRPPEIIEVPDAGHFVFLPPCPPDFAETAPEICRDAAGMDRAAFHRRLNREIRDFFHRTLTLSPSEPKRDSH
jgi:predicted dienelactone hydrolase